MNFVLLTWHGTIICRRGQSSHLCHLDILDAAGVEWVFEPNGHPKNSQTEPATDWLETTQAFEFDLSGYGLVIAIRAASGRGFYIKTGATYLTAPDDEATLCCDRSHPQTWETFLPLRHDKVSVLQTLKSKSWIELGSRRRVPKERISVGTEFWFKLGVRNLDLARDSVAAIQGVWDPDGGTANGQFIVPAGLNSLETLVPETEVKRDIKAPKDIVLNDAGNSPYVNATAPDQLFLKGPSLTEKWITEKRFLQPPFFVTTADREFFYREAWNGHAPKIGETNARVAIRSGEHKCVVLSRLAEGTILDEGGVYKGMGFLRVAPTLPRNMRYERGQLSYKEGSLDNIEEIAGTICIPINGNLQNYYHWLIDALLSLETIKSTVESPFSLLLPSNLTSFSTIQYVQSLTVCGFDHIPVLYSSSEIVRVERALWMECRDPFEDIPADVIRGFQARMAAAYANTNLPKHRIFIERAHLRGVLNSSEMNAFLAEQGFTAYRLEDMPFEEQVALFSNAEFVISPHGAGLSNLIFSPKGTKVLELMPDVESRPFFWHLSATLGHHYGQMACPVQPKLFNGRLHVDQKRLKFLYDLLEAA